MNLFNHTIRSNSKQKSASLRPIYLSSTSNLVFDRLEKYLKDNNFKSVISAKDYHEIYATKSDAEYTFMVFVEQNHTTLSVMIYTQGHTFSKKKLLASILSDLRKAFADSLQ